MFCGLDSDAPRDAAASVLSWPARGQALVSECRELAWSKPSKLATQTKQAAPWATRASIPDSQSPSIWSADILGNDAACVRRSSSRARRPGLRRHGHERAAAVLTAAGRLSGNAPAPVEKGRLSPGTGRSSRRRVRFALKTRRGLIRVVQRSQRTVPQRGPRLQTMFEPPRTRLARDVPEETRRDRGAAWRSHLDYSDYLVPARRRGAPRVGLGSRRNAAGLRHQGARAVGQEPPRD